MCQCENVKIENVSVKMWVWKCANAEMWKQKIWKCKNLKMLKFENVKMLQFQKSYFPSLYNALEQ